MEPLISVIVPIYQVEPYLRKCLDSIIGQTYRNLEIILVDDGSLDKCGAICDEYAARDKRIIVIHKENGGVSSARNVGLQKASGDYIGWVDPDDWIEPDMFDYMMKKIMKYGADIAVSSRKEIYSDKEIMRGWEKELVLNREMALSSLLENDVMQNYCCDKLFRANLWKGIVFPEGRIFEDMAVMYHVFHRANSVICLSECKYNYHQHSGSAVTDTSIKSKLDYLFAVMERYEAMQEQWPQFKDQMLAQCYVLAIELWCNYYANPKEIRRKVQPQLREVSAFCVLYLKKAKEFANFGLAGKIVLKLISYTTWWSFALSGLINWIYKRKHGGSL